MLAGLEQTDLAKAAGLHTNSIRRLERMDRIPKSSWHAAGLVVGALRVHGVQVESDPAPAVRLL